MIGGGGARGPGVLVGPHREWPAPFGVPGLVRAKAESAPDAVVLACDGRSVTYAQLESASDAVAARLREEGSRAGDVVAVCLPRGAEMVTAFLGALKAGTAYLPLAPEDPPQRRDTLLRRSGARHVLVTAGTEALVDAADVTPVRVPQPRADAGVRGWAPLVAYGPRHPVYVLYTSGSTGSPKGVVVPSEALVNRLLWMVEAFGIGPRDRILQKTPYTFDVSGWELWCPLIAGARLVLMPPGTHTDPGEVVQRVVRSEVTVCHFVPSMLTEFLRWPGAGECRSLRAVVCSGERLTPGQVRQFRRVLDAELYNLYGPTEAAIDVSFWRCPADRHLFRTLIGEPITNCALVVLNPDRTATPVGAVGELAIGGVPVGLGYLNAPELTESAFVAAPSWAPVDRVYLTGDLVRQHPDGLELIGRRDTQVKIRGQRVELTAVEDALRGLSGVVEAAAATVEHATGTELCALVTTSPDAPGLNGLRSALAGVLPASHRPTRLFPVDDIPLTPSGKLDRKRVGELAAAFAAPGRAADAGPAAGYDQVAHWWHEATGSPPSRPDVGFLDAGGHSLMAARLVGLILRHRGVRLSLRDLMRDNLSLNDLRRRLDTAGPPEPADEVPGEHGAPSPHVHGLWLWHRIFPGCPAYNVTAVLGLDRRVDLARLQRATDALVSRHRPLWTTFHASDGRLSTQAHPPADAFVPVQVAEAAQLPDQVLDQVFEAARLPRLAVGVWRRPGDAGDLVVLAFDHLVTDQRSLDLLLADLAAAYGGQPLIGGAAPVPLSAPLPAARRDRDLSYWATRLRDAPPALELPFRLGPPIAGDFRGRSVDVPLGQRTSELVRRHCAEARVTPFVVALTVFARRLSLWAGVDDLVVGVPMSGRESTEELDAVGFFVRTLPVRLTGLRRGAIAEAVQGTAEALFDAAEHASVSFEEVVQRLGGSRTLHDNPVFQVWCNDLGAEQAPTRFGEATARLLHPPERWSLFEVGLYLRHAADGLTLRLAYRGRLWAEEVAEAFLDACVADLRQAVGDTVAGSAVTGHDPPGAAAGSRRTCADLVGAVLERGRTTSDRLALVGAGGRLTYGQLRRRILQVSAGLAASGGDRGATVGVLARRHVDLAPAILGCWHAGAVPLLLDPDLPDAGLRDVLAAAGVRLVCEVAPAPVPRVAHAPARRLALTGDWWPAAPLAAPDAARRDPDGIGHGLLTSGSTGMPALVRLPADALPAVLDGYADVLGLGPDDVFGFTVPPAHDPVFRDLILPLLIGARVAVPAAAEQEGRGLVRWLTEVGASVLHLTPAQGALLAAAYSGDPVQTLRRVVFHGDTLRYADVAAMRRLAPRAEIHNLYGTTETPQASGLRLVLPTESGSGAEPVPIAASAPYRRLAVHGPGGGSGTGVLGEIVVTGVGLAKGAGRAGADADVPAGAGGYRTGDLGRLRPDGLIEIVGRADRQISVRGHRIQMDGVETVMRRIPGVRDCHVAVGLDGAGLVTWWCGDTSDEAVRNGLRQHLPEVAIPTEVHRVASIPTTGRGKVDTAALLRASTPVPSRPGPVGGQLVDLVLGCLAELRPESPPGLDDDFFSAGLTSLGLLRLYELVRGRLDAPVQLADFFQFPTARRLAERLAVPAARSRQPSRSRLPTTALTAELRLRRAARRAAADSRGRSREHGY